MLVPDWRNEERKHRRTTLTEEDVRDNTTAWRIDSREKLLTEMNKDPDGVLTMILDMRKTYMEYLDQANKADNQRDKIRMRALGLEQELYISNEEKKQAVSLLQQQTVKVKYYERMIDALQSSVPLKPDIPLPSIKRSID